MKSGFGIAASVVLAAMSVQAAGAHEFWIDGTIVKVEGETRLELDLKVGQMLEGLSLPYIPDTTRAFTWIQGGSGKIRSVTGAIPAASVSLDENASAVIFHRTVPRKLIHRDWAKFLDYLAMEGLEGIADMHKRRELPQSGFAETYARHAKFALIGPGRQQVRDKYQGSPLEIVLDKVANQSGDLVLSGRVIEDAAPGARQITVFHTTAHGPSSFKIRTQANGGFTVRVPGDGPVLLNTVKMSPGPSDAIAWHSDWASLYLKQRPP